MTITHALLLLFVPGAIALALGVDLAALVAWLRQQIARGPPQ